MSDPRNIRFYSRAMMVEQIMALIGRSAPDPKSYRRTLESFEPENLQRTLNTLTGRTEAQQDTNVVTTTIHNDAQNGITRSI
jgi:hypothetical protein